MTTRIREWSQSASGNSSPAGLNWAEGMAPSAVNNTARLQTAQIRQWYDPTEGDWIDWSATHSVASQTTFKLAGDQTALFAQGRRIRHRGGTATVYSTVLSASFTAETTVTIEDKSGSLSASMSIAGLALAPIAMPRRIDKLDVSGTLSVGTLVVSSLPNLTVTGSATLSGTVTMLTALNVSGTLSVGGNLLVAGNATIAGSVTMSGTVTLKTALNVSGTLGARVVLVTGTAFNPAMVLFANLSGIDNVAMPGAVTNSYSISVAGFSPAASCGHGILIFDDANTVDAPRIVINGNGPYPIVGPSFGSLTANSIVAGRIYQLWFQGGVLTLLNPSAE